MCEMRVSHAQCMRVESTAIITIVYLLLNLLFTALPLRSQQHSLTIEGSVAIALLERNYH